MAKDIKTNSLRAWLLASRPQTLTGAAVPVMLALAMSWRDMGNIQFIPAILCMLFAFIMQIDANFVNDYFDWRRGNDDEATRLGPLRACSQGWVTPKAMLCALVITTLIACCIGLPLVIYGGWEMILVGIACVIFCVLYTTTLSYIAMGDLLVLVFFGIVPVCLTYYLQTGEFNWQIFLLSVGCGLVIDNLLLVNNYRDIDNDRMCGKKTLVVFIGKNNTELLYMYLGVIGYVIACSVSTCGYCTLLLIPYLVFHIHCHRLLRKLTGRELNRVLGMTARNNLIYGILASLALLL